MAEKILAINLDADDSIFFARELEHVKARTYDIVYQDLRYQQFLPVSSEANPGADTITFQQYDQVGMAKIISNYADDLPRCDVKGIETTIKVRGIGDSYGYNVQEIRASRLAGRNLDTRRASVCRRAIEQVINSIAWLANGENGMYGLFYHPNVTKGPAVTGGWATATQDQILADLMDAVDSVTISTHGMERVDTLLMPLSKLQLLNSVWRSANSDTTILEFFRKQRPFVTVDYLEECAGLDPKPSGTPGPTDIMVAYSNNSDKLTLEIPQMFEQFPAQPRNLEQVVPCHARCAGMLVYYPASVNVVEDL